jgi:hypothetical protein
MATGKRIFDSFFETEYVKSERTDDTPEIKAELKGAFMSAFELMTWWRPDETEYPSLGETRGYYNSGYKAPRVLEDEEDSDFEDYVVIIPALKPTWANDLSKLIFSIPKVRTTYFYLGILYMQTILTKEETDTFKGMSEEALHESIKPLLEDLKKNYLTSI